MCGQGATRFHAQADDDPHDLPRSATGALTANSWRLIAAGAAETVIALLVVFGCLTIAWLLVTLGLWRTSSSL